VVQNDGPRRLAIEKLPPCRSVAETPPNNGMHPTADTTALIKRNRSGRRVMPGVRRFEIAIPVCLLIIT
jgi:hypothetical protein